MYGNMVELGIGRAVAETAWEVIKISLDEGTINWIVETIEEDFTRLLSTSSSVKWSDSLFMDEEDDEQRVDGSNKED